MTSEVCYTCQEKPFISYKFKIRKDKENLIKNSIEKTSHCHRMCPECLIRFIFIRHITLFERPVKEYKFICPCGNGDISLTYEQLIDLFQNKTIMNLQQKKENKCNSHNKVIEKFCQDCKIDICEQCMSESIEKHYNHRIEDKKIMYEKLKSFFGSLNLKNPTFHSFMENFNNICKKFRDILEKNYNDILITLDQIINSLIDFRAKYSVHYKEKVINSVQTLKILKMFYSNYYYDIHKAENGTDYKIYKYLNQINYELDEVKFVNNKTSALDRLNIIKDNCNYLNENLNAILDINYSFRKVPNGYRKYQSILRCDDKNVKQIMKIDEHRIITFGDSYINCFEDNKGEFSPISKIRVKEKITSILLLKTRNLLTSFGKSSHFNIQEWVINDNYTNTKSDSNDDSILNKSINDLESMDNIDLSLIRSETYDNFNEKALSNQVISNNSLYKKSNSFVSNHKDDINVMVEMSDSMFASGGKDKRIIIWELDKISKKYQIFQEITKEYKNLTLKNEIKNMIYLYDGRLVSTDTSSIYIWYINPSSFDNPDGFYSFQQKINSNMANITAIYQVREGYLIFGTNTSNLEIWNDIDGKYQLFQNMNLKINEINAINQLKDNRIIVGSKGGFIKILELKKNAENQKVEYQLNEYIKSIYGLPINCMECFEDGSFIVGQKTKLHVWKNNESI